MLSDNEETVLNGLGLKHSQAKVYFALVKQGPSKVATISQVTKISREHLYPLLNSLEKMGLVEKELGVVNIYLATPLDYVLQMLVRNRQQEFSDLETKVKAIVERYQRRSIEVMAGSENSQREIKVTSNKTRSLNKAQDWFENAKIQIDLMHTWRRFVQFWNHYEEPLTEALDRGVKIRQLVDMPRNLGSDSAFLNREIFADQRFELRFISNAGGNFAVLDNEKIFMSATHAQDDLAKTPLLFSNYEGFVGILRNYFQISGEAARGWGANNNFSQPT